MPVGILKSLQYVLILCILNTKRLIVPSETYPYSILAYGRDVIPDPDLVGKIRRCLY